MNLENLNPIFTRRIYRRDCFDLDIRDLHRRGLLEPGRHEAVREYRYRDGTPAFRLRVRTDIRPDRTGRLSLLHEPHLYPYDIDIIVDGWHRRPKFDVGGGRGAYVLIRPPFQFSDRFEPLATLGKLCGEWDRQPKKKRKVYAAAVQQRRRTYRVQARLTKPLA